MMFEDILSLPLVPTNSGDFSPFLKYFISIIKKINSSSFLIPTSFKQVNYHRIGVVLQ